MATTRPYHHGNLRAELLERAEQTLRERGVEDLSLRELAREVGVSHAAPRRHFADRQALLDALVLDGFERLGEALAEAGEGGAFGERLTAMARAYVRFATEHAALLELMFARKHREGAEHLRAAGDLTFAPLLALVREGQRDGQLVPGDPEEVGLLAFATLHGLTALANRGMTGEVDLDAVIPHVMERLLHGLRPR